MGERKGVRRDSEIRHRFVQRCDLTRRLLLLLLLLLKLFPSPIPSTLLLRRRRGLVLLLRRGIELLRWTRTGTGRLLERSRGLDQRSLLSDESGSKLLRSLLLRLLLMRLLLLLRLTLLRMRLGILKGLLIRLRLGLVVLLRSGRRR